MVIANLEFATKCLVPKRGAEVICRRRLIDLMHNHIEMRAQMLCAPAGYGKTTLLVDFISELDIPVCWYSLDSSDQDPLLLAEGILSAVQSHFPEFGRQTQLRLFNCKDVTKEIPQLVGLLTGEMYSAIQDYFVLVLEDFHFVEDSEPTKAFLNLLLERAPDNCHIIISSRTPIELPALSKLYLQELAANMTMADLAFTASDVKELAALHGIACTDQEADALAIKTEGWIISIILSTYSLRAPGSHKKTFSVSHENVFRYLTQEVYDRQPPEVRSFLAASSILDELRPEVCDPLLGLSNSRQLLRQVEKKSLFIQCINYEKSWYRYHQLFREFLQRKLAEDKPDEFLSLHSKAGLFFESEFCWQEAITHYTATRHYDAVLRIIKSVGPDFQKEGKWATVSRWITALPESERFSDPDIVLLYAQSLVYLGDADEAARLLTGLLARINTDEEWLHSAKALSWRSAAFRITGHFGEARNDIEESIRLAEEHHGPADILGDAYRRLGIIHVQQSQLSSALEYFKRGLKCFSSIFDVAQMSDMHNSIGITYKRLGDLDRASAHFEYAREGWIKLGNDGALAMTLNNISYIYQRRGQHGLALETLRTALSKARETAYRRIEALVLNTMGEVLGDLGSYDEALVCYQQGLELAREVMESYYVIWAKAGTGEIYRLLGDLDKAEVLIKEALSQAREQGQDYDAALFNMRLGIVEYERGRYDKSVEILNDVCARFADVGDKDALARSYFHLAQAMFLSGKNEPAADWLEKASRLADELGYDDFLAIEGRNATFLMEFAISRSIGGERFVRIAETIRRRRSKLTQKASSDSVTSASRVQQPDVAAYALGETRVIVPSRNITDPEWRSHRAKELFFYLLSSDVGQTREKITAAIWPDLPPAKATSNFHINVYRLRRAIHPSILALEQGRYSINTHLNIWFDATEFEHALDQADSSPLPVEHMRLALERALQLYRGPFLSEEYGEWAERRRQELEDKFLRAILLLSRLECNGGRHARAIALLEKFIAIDPYHDEIYCQLMEEHFALGDQVSAARVYKQYLETVVREMDCPPSAQMHTLHKRLLTGAKAPR